MSEQQQKLNHKKETQSQDPFQKLLENAILVKKAVFHQAVANGYLEPETSFSSDDAKVGRRVEMWLTPNLLICKQNGKTFATPHSNCVYFRF